MRGAEGGGLCSVVVEGRSRLYCGGVVLLLSCNGVVLLLLWYFMLLWSNCGVVATDVVVLLFSSCVYYCVSRVHNTLLIFLNILLKPQGAVYHRQYVSFVMVI